MFRVKFPRIAASCMTREGKVSGHLRWHDVLCESGGMPRGGVHARER